MTEFSANFYNIAVFNDVFKNHFSLIIYFVICIFLHFIMKTDKHSFNLYIYKNTLMFINILLFIPFKIIY